MREDFADIPSRSPDGLHVEYAGSEDSNRRNMDMNNGEFNHHGEYSGYLMNEFGRHIPTNKPRHKRLYPSFDQTFNNNSYISRDMKGSNEHNHIRNTSNGSDMSSHSGINRTKRFSRFLPQHQGLFKANPESDEVPLIDGSEIYDDEVGQEPGVNVETMIVDIPESIGSQVTIIDYNTEDCEISHYDVEKGGNSFITGSNRKSMVQKNLNTVLEIRPKWSKVRWVVVNGLSWEAIKPIANHYNLHPLAVEDMLDIPQRTKMEIFDGQLFCCYPLHVLSTTPTPFPITSRFFRNVLLIFAWIFSHMLILFEKGKHTVIYSFPFAFKRYRPKTVIDDIENNQSPGFKANRREMQEYGSEMTSLYSDSFSKASANGVFGNNSSQDNLSHESPVTVDCIPYYTTSGTLCGDAYSSPVADKIRRTPTRSIYYGAQGNDVLRKVALQNMHIPGTSNSHEIALEQVSLFLVGDTVISFVEKSAPEIYGPLETRLKSRETILRRSSDPSILIQAILGASVDLFKPIMNAYRARLNKLQIQSLERPNLEHTRALYAFMTDLNMLRSPMSTIASTLAGLHSKCSASTKQRMDNDSKRNSETGAKQSLKKKGLADSTETLAETCFSSSDSRSSEENYDRCADVAIISEVSALYFSDVTDHAFRYLEDLNDMLSQSNTLISLIFDTISIHGSDYMKMLSLVSVVFLPLTFLTGYFGMNFKTFAMLDHDVGYYWLVAAPAAAILTTMVMFSSTKYQIIGIFGKASDLL